MRRGFHPAGAGVESGDCSLWVGEPFGQVVAAGRSMETFWETPRVHKGCRETITMF